jgi:uncharacterized protein (TIGR00369 family)
MHSLRGRPRDLLTIAPKHGATLVYSGVMKEKSRFAAVDAEYESRVRESFARQGLMKHLGAELAVLGAGHAEIHVPFRMEVTQQHNYFHAGVSGAIADSACGYAAYTLMPADSSVLTVEYKMNLLAPADGEKLMARARVLRSGRTLKICAADVYVLKGGAETHCATMLATIMCLAEKSDRAR